MATPFRSDAQITLHSVSNPTGSWAILSSHFVAIAASRYRRFAHSPARCPAPPSSWILAPDSSPPACPSSSDNIVSPWLCCRNRSCRTSDGYDSSSDPETTNRTHLWRIAGPWSASRRIRVTRLQTRQLALVAALHLTCTRSGNRPIAHAQRQFAG